MRRFYRDGGEREGLLRLAQDLETIMRVLGVTALLCGMLAACSPGDTGKFDPHAAAAPTPGATAQATFAGQCAWGEVKGATLSIWSYACGPESGHIHLVADDALPGFRRAGDAPESTVAIRIFAKPADAPIEAILPAVQAASPGPSTAACAFAPAPGVDHEGRADFQFAPTGADKAAYDAAAAGGEVPAMPCGELGVGPAGDRIFRAIAPDKVAYIDFGSEIQIFDATTLKVLDAH
jgi:hypothetical protein